MVVGSKNIAHPRFVAPCKVNLPSLMATKHRVERLNKDGNCFKYVCQKFLALTETKVKEGTFTVADIRKLLSDATFESTMKATEKAALQGFGDVDTTFLGSKNRHKNNNYTSIVNKTSDAFKDLG